VAFPISFLTPATAKDYQSASKQDASSTSSRDKEHHMQEHRHEQIFKLTATGSKQTHVHRKGSGGKSHGLQQYEIAWHVVQSFRSACFPQQAQLSAISENESSYSIWI